jgi:hypothetical protein
MCGALRRVVICFGWSGVQEIRQRGCEKENAELKDNVETRAAQRCVKDWRVQERIEEDEAPDMGAPAVERVQNAKRDFSLRLPAAAGSERRFWCEIERLQESARKEEIRAWPGPGRNGRWL